MVVNDSLDGGVIKIYCKEYLMSEKRLAEVGLTDVSGLWLVFLIFSPWDYATLG